MTRIFKASFIVLIGSFAMAFLFKEYDLGRAVEVKTLTPCDMLVLPRHVVLEVGDDWPLLYRNLFRDKVGEARGLYEILSGVLFYPLRARVAGNRETERGQLPARAGGGGRCPPDGERGVGVARVVERHVKHIAAQWHC